MKKLCFLQPELEINVSVDQQLINEDEFAKCNLVTVTLESLYSPPDAWNNPSQPYAYTVSLPLPLSDDVCFFVIIN